MFSQSRLGRANGHIAFYTLVLIPFFTALALLAVDVSRWSSLRDNLQREADRLTLHALRALPNQAIAQSYLVGEDEAAQGYRIENVDITRDQVSLTLEAEFKSALSGILNYLLTQGELKRTRIFSASTHSTAQLVPGDYTFVIVDGQSLRPGLEVNGQSFELGELFEDETTYWPASAFFNCAKAPLPDRDEEGIYPSWPWWHYWDDEHFQRWLTQGCFNPVLSPLKLSVISMLDVFTAHPHNRVAAVVTPGLNSAEGYFFLRKIRQTSIAEANEHWEPVGGFWHPHEELRQASLPLDNSWELFMRNEACLLFSHPQWDTAHRYTLPEPLPEFGFPGGEAGCADSIDPLRFACGRHFSPGWTSTCYLEEALTLREAVYWNAAKLSRSPQIVKALWQVAADLANEGGSPLQLSEERTRRGNMAAKAQRKVFLFTDTLPSLEEIDTVLHSFASAGIELFVVGFHHAQADPNLGLALASYREKAEEMVEEARGKPLLRVFVAEEMRQLAEDIVPKLIALGQEVSIKR